MKRKPQGRPTSRPSDFNKRVVGTLGVILAIAQAIEKSGSIPSGHLYAQLMGHLSLDDYQEVIATLVRAGIVRENPSHLLEWIAPSGATEANTNKKEKQQ